MDIKPFMLEEFFAKHEFKVEHSLCPSDCEPLKIQDLLSRVDNEEYLLWRNLWLGYTDSKGHPLLREEISKLYKSLTADDVLVATPEEGIFLAMMAILERGDKVIVPFPAYQSLYEIASSIGCKIIHWKPEELQDRWVFNTTYLCNLMRKLKPKMVVLNFPHNPTGSMITQNDMGSIITCAVETGTLIFSDEMYRFLEKKESDRLLSMADLYSNAVSLGGLSKSFALPGLRIGWLASKNAKLLAKIQRLKDYTTICASAPSEILAIIALRQKESIISRNNNIVAHNSKQMENFFRKYDHLFGWREPLGGSVSFVRYNGREGTKKFCENLLEQKSVLLAPALVFGAGDSHFRIGLGRMGMKSGLDQMEEYVKQLH